MLDGREDVVGLFTYVCDRGSLLRNIEHGHDTFAKNLPRW